MPWYFVSLNKCNLLNYCNDLFKFLLDTTDVQRVKAIHFENVLMIRCDFISGSDARGCMVVLVGEALIFNRTVNLTRCATCSSAIVNISYQLFCFRDVLGFDIESDGSIDTLAIPGKLTRNCTMAPDVLNPSENSELMHGHLYSMYQQVSLVSRPIPKVSRLHTATSEGWEWAWGQSY